MNEHYVIRESRSELYPEVLNAVNKNTSNEMSECLKSESMFLFKQARRNHWVFQHSILGGSVSFLSRLYYHVLGACVIQESDVQN